MVLHVLELFPDLVKGVSPEGLNMLVAQWIAAARKWGFELETDIEQFVELCVCHEETEKPEEHPWVLEILRYPDRSSRNKLVRLQERLIFRGGPETNVST